MTSSERSRKRARAAIDPVKRPFDIDEMIARLREAVKPYRTAALFELAAEGFDSPFEILLACIISIRTRDETTIPAAKHLFAIARTPAEVGKLSWQEIDERIRACTFHEPKARQILDIAKTSVEQFEGTIPCDATTLMGFRGVGPKCANLVLGIACQQKFIGVDIHVHRVTNRWGYVSAKSPEQTMAQLEGKLPKKYWVEINRLLVPFGKHICTGTSPKCSTCPVLEFCRQVGVTNHR